MQTRHSDLVLQAVLDDDGTEGKHFVVEVERVRVADVVKGVEHAVAVLGDVCGGGHAGCWLLYCHTAV